MRNDAGSFEHSPYDPHTCNNFYPEQPMKPRSLFTLTTLLALIAQALGDSIHAEEKPAQTTIAGWGTVTDSDIDCEYRFTADQRKLCITVPATPHDLSPIRGLNAPRVLRSVSGDFTVQVKITSDFKPGVNSTGKGRPFNPDYSSMIK